MTSSKGRDRKFIWIGLGTALLIGGLLSPWASQNPDGLDRVAQDHQFEEKALSEPPAHKLPFYSMFEEYAVRGVPKSVATPIAGIVGTLATFGLAWGLGKLTVKSNRES